MLVVFLVVSIMPIVPSTQAGSIFPIVFGLYGDPGAVYLGETPAGWNDDLSKPVVVFVQGLNNSASIWYIFDNMYHLAKNAGYQTAFVELHDSGGYPKIIGIMVPCWLDSYRESMITLMVRED
ncbi:hypothetical protein [Caldalkalibacillus mannanilyticus]|uniref:hypothetical protein n=1 Tax=Caldalkalibacillus mannanilyticus TaxID=1418 RepID=UPI000AFA6687|nr:hypothetical protein [Caldalkalibacillus mannanilyticus]